MSCPKCGSQKLWDDMMWWGCKSCDFMSDRIQNNLQPGDVFNEGTFDEWRANSKGKPDRIMPI